MAFHQPGEQLKLFYRPQEIMDRVDFSHDIQGEEDLSQMWARKERETRLPYGTPNLDPWPDDDDPNRMQHGAGLYSSVKQHGMTSHVQVADEEVYGAQRHYLLDGHHRVAAAAAVERDTGREMHVPVLHGESSVTTPSNGFYAASDYWPQNFNKKWDHE